MGTQAPKLAHSGIGRRAACSPDNHGAAPAGIDAEMQRCAVVFVVAQHGLQPSALDCVPLAGLKYGLQFVKAGRGSGPVAVAVPGKPTAAVYPHSKSVQGSEQDQDHSQARDSQKEHGSHERGNAPGLPGVPVFSLGYAAPEGMLASPTRSVMPPTSAWRPGAAERGRRAARGWAAW